jgi:hypothetical protein
VLVLRPNAPLSGVWDLSWEQRLEFEPGQPVSWPHLRPRTKLPLRQFAILPGSAEASVPVWRINGLKQIEFNQALAERTQGRGAQLYELTENPPWAEYLPHRAGDTRPEVILATHSLGQQNTAQVIGASTWDLLPEGAARVFLALPKGCELLQGRVDGLNLAWRKLSAAELQARLAERAGETILTNQNPLPTALYEVTLVNQFLPQRIAAVYRYSPKENADPNNIPLPALWNLAVRKSRLQAWQPYAAAPQSAQRREWDEAQARGYVELGALLQPALQASNAATPVWQQIWERRFRIQTQYLLADQIASAAADPEADKQQLQLLAAMRKLQGNIPENSRLQLSAEDVWRAFGLAQTAATYQVHYGALPAATLAAPALPAHDWRRMAMLMAAGLLSATMLALVAARTGWASWPGRHSTTSLLLAALLWYVYMQPREFAVLLAVLAVLTWTVKRREALNHDPTDFELMPVK